MAKPSTDVEGAIELFLLKAEGGKAEERRYEDERYGKEEEVK